MASFTLTVLEICSFKVQKREIFLEKFSSYEISKGGDKISGF